jgi:thymidylate kinase
MAEQAGAALTSGRLFVLTGIDGAGKSTALERLRRLRPQWAAGGYDPADWLPHSDLPELAELLDRHPREIVAELPLAERADFIAGLVSAHWRAWVEPRLELGGVVVLDSFHYRFRAKLALEGAPAAALERLAERLPVPRTVFLLAVDPAEAARRRVGFDRREHAGEASREGFVAFQTRLAAELGRLCGAEARELLAVDGSGSPSGVAERLIEAIERRLEKAAP